ncbi:MAG: CHRD domain-containing protein [Candidatus Marinimicrobia bacterium]|nr:CHRD domain-containing protein [Candidatus Neomarinimicrobiota bacterium]
MKKSLAILLSGIAFLTIHSDRLTAGTHFIARLDAAQQVHTVSPDTATGTGSFTLTDAGLAFNVTVEGLTGAITAAHFHNAAAGVAGGVVHAILGDFTGNTASGLWTSADSELNRRTDR